MSPPKKWIGVNDDGRRVGESHPRAELTDHEVELMRTMHEEDGWGYRRLARVFEVPRGTVQTICKYRSRGQFPAKFKRYG